MSAGRVRVLFRLGVGLSAGLLVAACSSVGGFVGDNLPTWAGGLPPGTPPRAGAPGYDTYLKSVGGGQPNASVPPAEAPAPAPSKPTEPVDHPIH
jgi:hypothetical protein